MASITADFVSFAIPACRQAGCSKAKIRRFPARRSVGAGGGNIPLPFTKIDP